MMPEETSIYVDLKYVSNSSQKVCPFNADIILFIP